MSYLLSSGVITDNIEKYIEDIFRLNLKIYPRDIPFSSIGFNFIMTDVKKTEALSTIQSRVSELINNIKTRYPSISLSLDSIDMPTEDIAKVVINVNGNLEEVDLDLYDEEI